MPIAVACSCGANLKAPDSAAGKRVKCPKCGDPLTVPSAVVEYEVVDDEPPTPAKKKPQLVDEDDDLPRPAKTKTKSKPAPVEVDEAIDDEDEEDEDERPKKKKGKKGKGKNREEQKKKKTLMLILGLCGAVFVLGAVGATIGIIMNTQDPAKITAPTKPAPPPLPAGWSTFKGDGFSVAVPDAIQFKEVQQPPGGPAGPQGNGKAYSNGVPAQPGQATTGYVVSAGPMPPPVAAEFAKSQEAGWEALKKAGGAGGQLQNEKLLRVGGVDGRQYTLTLGPVNGIVRVAVKGDKVYTCAVLTQGVLMEDGLEVKPFFDTFKIE